eukprot:Gb_07871 [translate_table: standard]
MLCLLPPNAEATFVAIKKKVISPRSLALGYTSVIMTLLDCSVRLYGKSASSSSPSAMLVSFVDESQSIVNEQRLTAFTVLSIDLGTWPFVALAYASDKHLVEHDNLDTNPCWSFHLQNIIQEDIEVQGFDIPASPDSSYNSHVPGNEDQAKEPPTVPPQLLHSLLDFPVNMSTSETLPDPQHVILDHLYIENRERNCPVVGLGLTHRFRSKFVTVVLYKPMRRIHLRNFD